MKKTLSILFALVLVLSFSLVTATSVVATTGPPVTAGLVLHLDASDAGSITKDGADKVSVWADLSGAANHATQAIVANQPTLVADELNGLPVVRFNGSSAFMLVPPILDPSQDNWSFFAVVTPTSMTSQDIWQQLDGTTGPGRVNVSIRTVATTVQYSSFLGGTQRPSGISVVATESNLITQTWDGTTLAWWGDGTTGDTHTPTAEPANGGYHIGVNKAMSGNWLNGDIAEILIYNRALSDGERQGVEQYLGVKWLGWTLPPGASLCSTTATNSGMACFTTSDGVIVDFVAVAPPSLPSVAFPHGMFSFKITGLTAGQTVTLTITFPTAVPVGTVWWKYRSGQWYSLPIGDDDGDNTITLTLTDGVFPGDTDGVANGTITDPGGPGNPMTVGWESSPLNKVAILAPWIALLAAIMAGASLLVLRRRRAKG